MGLWVWIFLGYLAWVEERCGFGYGLDRYFGMVYNLEIFLDIGKGTSVDVILLPPLDSEFPKEGIRHVFKSDS